MEHNGSGTRDKDCTPEIDICPDHERIRQPELDRNKDMGDMVYLIRGGVGNLTKTVFPDLTRIR